jgi:hypothetical protein
MSGIENTAFELAEESEKVRKFKNKWIELKWSYASKQEIYFLHQK